MIEKHVLVYAANAGRHCVDKAVRKMYRIRKMSDGVYGIGAAVVMNWLAMKIAMDVLCWRIDAWAN